MTRLEEKNSLLMRVADKGRLARLQNPEKQPIKIKITTFDGKVVVVWKLLTNIVKYTKRDQIENQIVEYTLSDGKETTKVEMPYLETVRDTHKVQVEVKRIITENGENTYTVEHEGTEYNILSKYVN